MPITIVPPGRNASAAALQKLFFETEQKLIREIIRKRGHGYVDYAEVAALERVRKTLKKMLKEAGVYVPQAVKYEFYKGAKALAGYANAESLTGSQNRAAEIIIDNLLGRIEEMAETAYQSTADKMFLVGRAESDLFRQVGLTEAAESVASGGGALTTVNEIISTVQNVGITCFVDKAGREWNLKAYGSMAVRTTVKQAQVAALLTQNDMQDLYKVINTGVPCRLCAAYGGRVYSKSGTSPFYPPLASAFGKIDPAGSDSIYNSFLNIHPNCGCSLVPYTEAGKTPQQIEKEREFSDPNRRPYDLDYRTKRQKREYEEKERQRAAYRANVKQYEKYVQAGVPGMPGSFATFLKHKLLNDDKYKAWLRAFRGGAK